jgi:hypothetical protein
MLLPSACAAALASVLLAAAPAHADPPEAVPTLALEVANPRRTGRKILHFEDLVGARARPVARPVSALLIVALAPGTRQAVGSELPLLAEAARGIAAQGGLVVGLLVAGVTAPDDPPIDAEAQPFVVVRDEYGLGKRRLGLVGPGQALVIRSDGRVAGLFGPGAGALARAVETTQALLKEER